MNSESTVCHQYYYLSPCGKSMSLLFSLQERIDEARASHSLNLRGMGLTSLPEEVLVLADTLQELLLTGNPLEVIPDWIRRLKKLKVWDEGGRRRFLTVDCCFWTKLLDVGNCQLKTLPTAIVDMRGHLQEITDKGNEGFTPWLDNLCASETKKSDLVDAN